MHFDPEHYHLDLAAAFVRGSRPELDEGQDEWKLCEAGAAAGLRLWRFKRNAELPRVRRVLGALAGLRPENLLDLGTGRGTFLWPLLEGFPDLAVTCVDADAIRARDLRAVHRGGIERLEVHEGPVEELPHADASFDLVTALEILEHLEEPRLAAREILRVSRRGALVTVPSRPDDNPEHLHLFTPESLRELFTGAGARDVVIESLRDQFFAYVKPG